jgi:hypothetical protein
MFNLFFLLQLETLLISPTPNQGVKYTKSYKH